VNHPLPLRLDPALVWSVMNDVMGLKHLLMGAIKVASYGKQKLSLFDSDTHLVQLMHRHLLPGTDFRPTHI
jgi:hypothetical protein